MYTLDGIHEGTLGELTDTESARFSA